MIHGGIIDHLPEPEGQLLSPGLVLFAHLATPSHVSALEEDGRNLFRPAWEHSLTAKQATKTSRNLIKEHAGWEEVGSDVYSVAYQLWGFRCIAWYMTPWKSSCPLEKRTFHTSTIELGKLFQLEEREFHPPCLPVVHFGPFLHEITLTS